MALPDELQEVHDAPEAVRRKAHKVATILRSSQHAIAFTGAGISTSAGIPDFRGPAGVWTLRDMGIKATRPLPDSYSPTLTHMALVGLHAQNMLQFVISQNTDGLHVRSGLPSSALAELHGNTNIEQCMHCARKFWRPFSTRSAPGVHDHATGRRCEACGGALRDTIVNFSESLPADQMAAAVAHARTADTCIVLGSSCRVTPAAGLPEAVSLRGGSLVIVNLQRTPLDGLAAVRVFSESDTFMALLMEELGLPIPPVRDRMREAAEPAAV